MQKKADMMRKINYLLILFFHGSIMGAAAAAAAMPEKKVSRETVQAASSIPRWQKIAACDKVALAKFVDEKLIATKGIVFDYLEGDNPEPLWQIKDTSGESTMHLSFSIGPNYVHKCSSDHQLYQSYDLKTGQELYRYQLPKKERTPFAFRLKSVLAHLPDGRIIIRDVKSDKDRESKLHLESFMAPRPQTRLSRWVARFQGVKSVMPGIPPYSRLDNILLYGDNNELIVDNGDHTLMLNAATLHVKGTFGKCDPIHTYDLLNNLRPKHCWKIGDDVFLARRGNLHFYKLPENYGAPHRTFDWRGKGIPCQIIKLTRNRFLVNSQRTYDPTLDESTPLQVANMDDGSVRPLLDREGKITHVRNDEFLFSDGAGLIHYWDLQTSWSPSRIYIDAQQRGIHGIFVRHDRSFIVVYNDGEITKFHLDNDVRSLIRPAQAKPEFYTDELLLNVHGDLMRRGPQEVQCLSLKSDVQLAYEAGKSEMMTLLAMQAAKDAKKKKPAAAAAAR